MMSSDGKHVTYGPYKHGDKLDFSEDPVNAMVSFNIFDYKIKDSRLSPPTSLSYYSVVPEEVNGYNWWTVINGDGNVADNIENLYFTFPIKPEDTVNPDSEDEVNHPKHYTGHKADIECIMFTELMPSLAANAFKYVWRCDDKSNRTGDLEKARWYLTRACELGCVEPRLGRKIQHLMVEMIDSSDFDNWHKLVLDKIVEGYYVDAYNAISDIIVKPRYCRDNSFIF